MKLLLLPLDYYATINTIYTACRTCYSEKGPIDIWNECKGKNSVNSLGRRLQLIKHVIDSGHHSTLEHIQCTFLIEGIDRATAQQVTRHRPCSYSMQSQRYCKLDSGLDHTTPNSIKNNPAALDMYNQLLMSSSDVYKALLDLGIKAEDARAVLPNSTCTNLVWSMNLRQLMHVCNERLCTCAQEPIRYLVSVMAFAVAKELPFMKPYLVPKCEMLGYCNESAQRSCGRKPLKEAVFKK